VKQQRKNTHQDKTCSDTGLNWLNWQAAVMIPLALFLIGAWGWHRGWFGLFTDLESLRTLALSFGMWAPLGIIALNIVQVIVSPVPGHALNIVSGYLFGPWLGTLYTLIGVLTGCLIVLLLVRWLGRPFAERLAGKKNLERFDAYTRRRGTLFLFWIFLFPFLPDDVACMAAGLTPLPIYQILFLALVGRTPGLFVANLIGHTATDLSPWQWAIFGVALVAIAALFWRFHENIEVYLMQCAERFTVRRKDSDNVS